nr:MAG TPA: hypothetical protein [Caudoviricetes sp.]
MRRAVYPMLNVSCMSYACILTCMCLHLHAHLDVYRALWIVLPYRRMYPSMPCPLKC